MQEIKGKFLLLPSNSLLSKSATLWKVISMLQECLMDIFWLVTPTWKRFWLSYHSSFHFRYIKCYSWCMSFEDKHFHWRITNDSFCWEKCSMNMFSFWIKFFRKNTTIRLLSFSHSKIWRVSMVWQNFYVSYPTNIPMRENFHFPFYEAFAHFLSASKYVCHFLRGTIFSGFPSLKQQLSFLMLMKICSAVHLLAYFLYPLSAYLNFGGKQP